MSVKFRVKSERLLEILLLLQARSPRSAPELATALHVTERTIYRDVEALSAAGVPVFTTRGVYGGIGLVEGYRRAVPKLDEGEVRALFVDVEDPLADLGLGGMFGAAREKLFGALSDRQRSWATVAGGRVRIERQAWGQAPQPTETLAQLRQAVWDDRRVAIDYRDQEGRVSSRVVDPLALVLKGSAWYAVARNKTQIRTYRVERILRLDMSAERFERPGDFRLDEYWEQTSKHYESKAVPCHVVVVGKSSDLDRLAVFWPVSRLDSNTSNIARAEVVFPLQGVAVRELLLWSAELEVISPTEVRKGIIDRLTLAEARYSIKYRKRLGG